MKKGRFLYFDDTEKVRYNRTSERSTPSVQNHIDIVIMKSSQGRIRLLIGNTGSDEQFLVDNTIIRFLLRAGSGLETNIINSAEHANVNIKRNGTPLITLYSLNEGEI